MVPGTSPYEDWAIEAETDLVASVRKLLSADAVRVSKLGERKFLRQFPISGRKIICGCMSNGVCCVPRKCPLTPQNVHCKGNKMMKWWNLQVHYFRQTLFRIHIHLQSKHV